MKQSGQDEIAPNTGAQGKSILIVGAGFAGLATAYWMNKLGYAVTIVELASSLKRGGTPVDIRGGVVEVVRRMGLLDRIISLSLPPRSMEFLDGHGTRIAGMAAPAKDDQGGNAPDSEEEYEIERDVLLDLLFNEVEGKVEFLFADSIEHLNEAAEGVEVTFRRGLRRHVSLVLGCDGTHSAVRKMCFGEEALFSVFLQHYFSLAIVDKLLIPEDTAQIFNIPGRAVMLTAYQGRTDIGFCFLSEAEISYDRRDRDEQKRMVLQRFEGGGWRIGELLQEMTQCKDFYFDKLCQIRMDSWSKGRIGLVGDAAYCPSPAAGMGGSMAILGAAALADAFRNNPGEHIRAFQEYDRSFRTIAEQIQAHAIEFGMELVMPRSEEAIQKRNLQLNGG